MLCGFMIAERKEMIVPASITTYCFCIFVRMVAKLTLSVDESIIDQAKALASKNGRSLSSIVSEFLQNLIEKNQQKQKLPESPIVERLAGILDLPDDFDHKEVYGNYLLKKYG